ncbi:MAG TPA: GNAT family N-acetyltransferase [Candidatus Merdimorpha stercoravium]|uniref:GNAT family N-acetyltransferase n=1 Tax=Candidatus Merdimorpha stercoravium TaxID=2840863 RepID=A0A9D1H8E9_9FLAO|nr:GNAT family N-acetyltransferase [Candidatus Merdimorpha stercoravium]
MENDTTLPSKEAKNTLEIVPVDASSIGTLAALAEQVWHECFARLLSREQIEYMLARFQSEEALARQMQSEGYAYYFLRCGRENAGYFGIRDDGEGRLFLSKLYILRAFRGQRLSSAAFDFMEGECRRRALKAIWLTVNRHNETAIRVYLHRGFVVREEKVADIGCGFVMDDFIMEKVLS